MPSLRPWIGVEQIHLIERGVGEPSEEIDRVSGVKPDIVDGARVDRCKDLCHAVDERLAADEAAARMVLGLADQMLAAAETDLEAQLIDRNRKQIVERPWRRGLQIDGQPGQQRLEERGLMRPQPMPFAPAEEAALGLRTLSP